MVVLSTILFPSPAGMAALLEALGLVSHSLMVQPLCIPTTAPAKVLGLQALLFCFLSLPLAPQASVHSKWDVWPSAAS